MNPVRQIHQYSLQTRLVLAVSILLAVFLGLTGIVLDRAFRNSVEAGVAEQLQLQIYVLLAAVDEEGGAFYFSEDFREPRLSQLNSGLYGFISSPTLGELLRTPSAVEMEFTSFDFWKAPQGRGESDFARVRAEGGEEYFMISYGVVWENSEENYTFSILESTNTYLVEVGKFRTSLWSWLGGVAALLMIVQVLLMRWGLEPLRLLARDLKRIESGEGEQLSQEYPRELLAVTENLNLLIKAERKQQARYRTTLGDLAHSLKTPLAVIHGIIDGLKSSSVDPTIENDRLTQIEEQIDRMNQIVSYQLQRAVNVNEATALSKRVDIAVTVKKLIAALDKVYAEKRMTAHMNIEKGTQFLGDERDLMEMLGNLLDNAYKYGHSRVEVNVQIIGTPTRQLSITVDDDGPGIPVEHREYVLQRGARVDTLERGQGIGLAVVTDIVSSYGGVIEVANNDAGGARVQLVFSNFHASNSG